MCNPTRVIALLGFSLSFAGLGACGGDAEIKDSPGSGGPRPGSGAGGGGSGPGAGPVSGSQSDFMFPPSSGTSGPGTGSSGLPSGMSGSLGAPGTPGAPDGDKACAETKAEVVRLPVDLYIVQDRSGSMNQMNKWTGVKNALTSFVQAPETAGISVGLGFFPRPAATRTACMSCTNAQATQACFQMCGCTTINCPMRNGAVVTAGPCRCTDPDESCSKADYVPAAVGIEALPAVGPKIVAALNSTMVSGGTPTLPALEGAVQFAKEWLAGKNRRMALALATDGQPTICPGNTVPNIANVAKAALADGIPTFVIGVGPNLANLNAMAVAGGTTKAFLIEGADVQKLFLDALKEITGQANRLSCSYGVPAPPLGQTLDPKKVNVRFTGGEPPKDLYIIQVGDKGSCGAQGGWYYDDPAAPKSITLCDSSCQMVNQAGAKAEIAVLFGCASRIIP